MNANLMDTVKGMLTSDAVGNAAGQVGESADGMRKATSAAVPTVFAALAGTASAPGGATRVFGAVTQTGLSGQSLVTKFFGDRSGAVTDVLSNSSGVGSRAGSHALSMVFPLVVSVLGRHVLSNRLDSGGLAQTLFSHKKAILDDPSTPPGLASALGMGSLSELGGAAADVGEPHTTIARTPEVTTGVRASQHAAAFPQRVGEVGRRRRWGFLIPLLILGALLIWGLTSLARIHPRMGATAPQPTTPTLPKVELPTAPSTESAPTPMISTPGHVKLPDGKMLDVTPGTAEAAMAHDLGDTSMSLPRTYDFADFKFDSGSATLPPDATRTSDDLAAMLQAYPSSRIRVDGHTDVTGDPAANQALSEARADSVKGMLTSRGIAADRIETAGEASREPAPGNETRALSPDRRAEVVLLSR